MARKRSYDTLIGGSVGWNQLCNDASVTVQNGHKYYLKKGDAKSIGASTGTAITDLTSGSDMVIDLTLLLGSTIADYIYGLEQATAGAGIAKLREWGFIGDAYIPYDAGSLESVEATAHKMVGFNQWDEETESGYVNPQTGAEVVDSTKIRMKNFMPVLPNTTYYKKSPTTFWNVYFDADKNYIGFGNAGINQTFTTPNNCRYIRCGFESVYGTTYNHDICINLSNPDRNGEYEPYKANTYDLGTDTLRGLFKLDSNNNLYADGDTKASDGVITRKYGVVDLGTLNWTYSGTTGVEYFYGFLPLSAKRGLNNAIASQYAQDGYDAVNGNNGTFGINASGTIVKICDLNYTDAIAFKQMLTDQNVKMVYEKQTPTTEQSTPFQSPQVCYPDGTEEYTTNNGVPVGHETRYQL